MYNYFLAPECEGNAVLQRFLENLPARFDAEGYEVHRGRNVVKLFVLEGGREVAVKRYGVPNVFQQVGRWLHGGKARKAYRAARRLQELGFLSPAALGVGEETSGARLKHSFLVTDVVRHEALSRCLQREEGRRQLSQAFALFVKDLHEKGVIHNDLNQTNELCEFTAAGAVRFWLIDINRMKFFPPGSVSKHRRFENLTRFSDEPELFRGVAEAYVSVMGYPASDVRRLLTTKQRHDRNRRIRKAIVHPCRTYRKRRDKE